MGINPGGRVNPHNPGCIPCIILNRTSHKNTSQTGNPHNPGRPLIFPHTINRNNTKPITIYILNTNFKRVSHDTREISQIMGTLGQDFRPDFIGWISWLSLHYYFLLCYFSRPGFPRIPGQASSRIISVIYFLGWLPGFMAWISWPRFRCWISKAWPLFRFRFIWSKPFKFRLVSEPGRPGFGAGFDNLAEISTYAREILKNMARISNITKFETGYQLHMPVFLCVVFFVV